MLDQKFIEHLLPNGYRSARVLDAGMMAVVDARVLVGHPNSLAREADRACGLHRHLVLSHLRKYKPVTHAHRPGTATRLFGTCKALHAAGRGALGVGNGDGASIGGA